MPGRIRRREREESQTSNVGTNGNGAASQKKMLPSNTKSIEGGTISGACRRIRKKKPRVTLQKAEDGRGNGIILQKKSVRE